MFNTFNGLSHRCLFGSFWIFWDCEGQDRGPNAKALIWVLVDDLLVGDLRWPQATSGDRLEDMPWHAMTCHDMPWHAFILFRGCQMHIYRLHQCTALNILIIWITPCWKRFRDMIQGCFLVTMICWVEILMWQALRTCLDWNWLPRAVLDQSAIRFYNSEQVLCWLHWMLQCILGDALDKSLQIWL